MSDLTEQLCLEALQLVSSLSLKVIYIVRCLLGIVGTICAIFLFKKKSSSWIPNPNTKVLFLTHIYLTLHVSFFFFLEYCYQLIRLSFSESNSCHFVMRARLSCLIRLIPVVGIHGQTANMFTFSIERAISTIWPRRYEKIKRPYFGVFLNLLAAATVIGLDYFLIYFPTSENKFVSGLTARNMENMDTYFLTNCINCGMEIITIIIFSLTYYLNVQKSRLTRSTNLADRYQISENKRVIRILLPCFVVHFLLNVSSYGGQSLYPFFYPQYDIISSSIWVESISQAQTYTVVLPLVLFWQMNRSNQVVVYNPETTTDIYFQQLNRLFNVHT